MRLTGLLFGIVILSACSTYFGQQRNGISSSLVDFLYPGGEVPPPVSDAIPNLTVPLRVGVAFVPGRGASPISEVLKTQLLEKTKAAFSGYDFISEIVVIPDAYLRTGGGWESLGQVSRLYQTDVMALVSYDQVANTDDNKASLLYWTIVGAYIIEGTNQAVQTFVDTAVFDVPTQRLLFRAPGINRKESSSTLINLEEELRESQAKSFAAAFDDMNTNLATELGKFRERIKTERVATVTQRGGSGGGSGSGAVGLDTILILLGAGIAAVVRRGRRNGEVFSPY
jgi:rhombotail lipoprotein